MSRFSGAWMSLNFYKEYLFGFETLVFAASEILSMHKQLVTLRRESKTWNSIILTALNWLQDWVNDWTYTVSSSGNRGTQIELYKKGLTWNTNSLCIHFQLGFSVFSCLTSMACSFISKVNVFISAVILAACNAMLLKLYYHANLSESHDRNITTSIKIIPGFQELNVFQGFYNQHMWFCICSI